MREVLTLLAFSVMLSIYVYFSEMEIVMSKNKRVIYIAAAVVLILIGLRMDREPAEDTSTESLVESVKNNNVAAESNIVTEGAGNSETNPEDYIEYYFRNEDLLEQHYKKHGMEMGFESMEAYEEAAGAVVYHPDVLVKTEKEDGDHVYYIEESNEFVVISQDGYIRTYFNPSDGIDYFNRQ